MAQYQIIQREKVFFVNLNSATNKASLEAYLSKDYQIRSSDVPPGETGKNKNYGVVVFADEDNVDRLMTNRPHRIDGTTVEVYRSIPDQGSLKDNKGIKNLIVFGINGRLSRLILEKYFEKYGKINHLLFYARDDIYCIEFDDYDSVDQALLDKPYIIDRVKVELKKGDRFNQRTIESSSQKVYCIHIKNIPSRFDASELSEVFEWSLSQIVMKAAVGRQLSTECWLKDMINEQMAQNFLKSLNNRSDFETKIFCEMEEDQSDLCKYFGVGTCSRIDGSCLWQHIECTEYETCSDNTCRYGHRQGLKVSMIDNGQMYQIKITGFQTPLTCQSLARYLHYNKENQCYVNQHENQIGYINKLTSRKYAQNLMKKWHEKQIEGGHKLTYQLQAFIFPTSNVTPNPDLPANNPENYRSPIYTPKSGSRTSSVSRDDNDTSSESGIVTTNRPSKTVQMKSSPRNTISSMHTLSNRSIGFPRSEGVDPHSYMSVPFPSELSLDGWEETEKVEETDGRVRLIRGKKERRRLAVLKFYSSNILEEYSGELETLQILKDVNNVPKLIRQKAAKPYSWIVLERARGHSLRKFFDRKYRNELNILDAIKLSQQLLNIIKQIHSQNITYENLSPDHVMIEWDYNQTSIDQAQLTLINFSQQQPTLDNANSTDHQIKRSLYRPLLQNIKEYQGCSTVDAFGICAILYWLMTKTDPEQGYDQLPHEMDNAQQILDKQIREAVRTANVTAKKGIGVEQLKTYLNDTFKVAFNSRDRQPWTIGNLEYRLESIRALLTSPSDPSLETTEAIFQDLMSIRHTTLPSHTNGNFLYGDILEKAANAFCEGKRHFVESTRGQCSWSDGSCIWMNNPSSKINERQHDDILTFYTWNQGALSTCSIIIKCVATVQNEGNIIALAIASPIGNTMNSIPIGYYGKGQNYAVEFKTRFVTELENLLRSICHQRKVIQQ